MIRSKVQRVCLWTKQQGKKIVSWVQMEATKVLRRTMSDTLKGIMTDIFMGSGSLEKTCVCQWCKLRLENPIQVAW